MFSHRNAVKDRKPAQNDKSYDDGSRKNPLHNRWVFLAITCIGQIGYCWSIITPSVTAAIHSSLNISNKDSEMIIRSCLLLPPLLAGFLLDAFGSRLGFTVGSFVSLLGLIGAALGTYLNSSGALTAGQILLLISKDAILIGSYKLLFKRFKDRDLFIALSLSLSVQGVETLLAYLFSMPSNMQDESKNHNGAFIAPIIGLLSFICSVIASLLDYKRDKNIRTYELLTEEDNPNRKVSVKQLPRLFWTFCLEYTLGMAVILCLLNNYSSPQLTHLSHFTQNEAVFYSRIPTYVLVISAPLIGAILTKFGRICGFMAAAHLLGFLSCLALAVLSDNYSSTASFLPVLALSLARSLLITSFSCGLQRIIPTKNLGMALGFTSLLINVFSFLLWLLDDIFASDTKLSDSNYRYVYGVFAQFLLAAAFGTYLVVFHDYGQKLKTPPGFKRIEMSESAQNSHVETQTEESENQNQKQNPRITLKL